MEEKKKSPLMRHAISAVKDILDRLENGECKDEEIGYILGKLNTEHKGYFKDDSFANYDQAMRILNIGDRQTMLNVLKKHGVEQHTINNRKMGFLRSEVEAVALTEKRPPIKRRFRN